MQVFYFLRNKGGFRFACIHLRRLLIMFYYNKFRQKRA